MNPKLQPVLFKFFKKDAIEFLAKHEELFDEVIQLSLTDEDPYCWRSAWLVSTIMAHNDARVAPYVDALIESLNQRNDGHQREIIHVLQRMDLNEDQLGMLYDRCVTIWESIQKKPGTRYVAFQEMIKMVEQYPELKQEIEAVTQPPHINSLSPGVRQSVLKKLTALGLR
jgi:hypothetical protein